MTRLARCSQAYEAACRELTEPWYHISVETDRARQARYRRDGQPGSTDTPSVMDQLLRLGADDPIVGRAILRAVNLLATPQQLMNEPEVMSPDRGTGRRQHARPLTPAIAGPGRGRPARR